MTIYEREGGVNFGPFHFGGKPGQICEPYKKSITEINRGLLRRFIAASEYEAILDVGVDEISVLEYPMFGDSIHRIVKKSAINWDPSTSKHFIYKDNS